MQINAEIDNKQLLLRLRNGPKRLAFAVVNAINNTQKRIQKAEFARQEEQFEIRKPAFFFGTPARPGGVGARIKPFASVRQGRPFSEIFVAQASSIGSQRRLLLSTFERGGPKKEGGRSSAVPITGGPARPTFGDPVQPEFTFARMRLVAHRAGKRITRATASGKRKAVGLFGEFGRVEGPRDDVQYKGRAGTFIARTRTLPEGGVFQRIGRDIRLVWIFRRGIRVPARLRFERTAKETADRWFAEEMEKETIKAIEFDRGRGLL